ncbi:hypothetical protein [Streptomyces brasiliensis]|uniref:Uncharacterized protein n=1 Tax=Streptomyces brasiliensis TaxID=1954 RepID=A0A917NKV7_9ACTN|nr:hypothetical protein [Streptomyces brasiliensis]GGJ08851.1 hypothetical protein GCM10010121_018980 [Streptomyces brasiliensis]
MKWTRKAAPVEQPGHEPELSAYQRALRDRLLAAPVVPAPEPWQPVFEYKYGVPVGGLLGIGFAPHPDSGHDLVMVVSHDGHGLFEAVTGEKIARNRDPDPEGSTPDAVADLSCPGLGPLAGSRVRIAGLFGGGLHTTAADGWTLEAVAPAWPNERVLLSRDGGLPHSGPYGEQWWHIFHSDHAELRAAGFSPSGRTLAVATSSDLSLWTRRTDHSHGGSAET